jgi:hypothetical protein
MTVDTSELDRTAVVKAQHPLLLLILEVVFDVLQGLRHGVGEDAGLAPFETEQPERVALGDVGRSAAD